MLSGNMWAQQAISSLDRGTANDMMEVVANDIRKNYYDPKFHGVDWDTRVAATKLQINKSTSMDMAFSYIAALVDTLNDSHTMFYPPARNLESNFGFDYQMIGADRCYVTRVRPGSDAEAKGMKPGNEIITINGYLPDRENVWKMGYIFNVLRPQDFLRVRVQLPSDGSSREIQVKAKVVPHKNTISLSWSWGRYIDAQNHSMRARSTEFGDELMILKLPYFEFTNSEIGNMIGRARKHQTLILDLRGNPGGATETLTNFVGALFEKQVKIADRVTRKETKPWVAKPQHIVFTGKLIVLVDSDSASASELLARVVQLEKRGTVIGDRTSGSVMEAKYHRNQMGGDFIMFYGESITDANLIMTDGKSLEHVGVTPDESIVPTAQDLANNQDPVLSHAAEMAGVKLTPEAAAKIFPYEWPSE
jgi:carboxyl-terminal processing protease